MVLMVRRVQEDSGALIEERRGRARKGCCQIGGDFSGAARHLRLPRMSLSKLYRLKEFAYTELVQRLHYEDQCRANRHGRVGSEFTLSTVKDGGEGKKKMA